MAGRRTFLLLGALGLGAGLAASFWPRPPKQAAAPPPPPKAFHPGRTVTMGFIYTGDPADGGYNQSHADAARELARKDWVRVVEAAHVPEDASVVDVMRRMIERDGAEFVFPTSYGYFDPHLLGFAPEFPEVHFLHTGGLALPGHPPNISSCYGYIDEAMFLCGVAAGYATEGAPWGFIGAIPIPVVLRNINAFTLGTRVAQPEMQVHVRFSGSWHDPERETQLARELVAAGVAGIACHVDSPVTIMKHCETAAVRAVGYHIDQSSNAPTQFLTGAEWRWAGMYEDYVRRHLQNKGWPTMLRGGLRDGMVSLSDMADTVPAEARRKVELLRADMVENRRHIYEGPVLSNTGEVMVPEGMHRRQDDPWLETMDWFVEGVVTTS